jgi:hypothetical protein
MLDVGKAAQQQKLHAQGYNNRYCDTVSARNRYRYSNIVLDLIHDNTAVNFAVGMLGGLAVLLLLLLMFAVSTSPSSCTNTSCSSEVVVTLISSKA